VQEEDGTLHIKIDSLETAKAVLNAHLWAVED
jgi:hypothetical protein